MLKEIVNFEVSYHKKQLRTYIYFGVLFLIGFLMIVTTTETNDNLGLIQKNKGFFIFQTFSVVSILFILVVFAVIRETILKEFEYQAETFFLTKNITKFDYLIGRLFGASKVLFFISLSIPLGIALGDLITRQIILFSFELYLYFYAVIILPNLIITVIIFFSFGVLSHKTITVFMVGVLLLCLYVLSILLLDDKYGALLDPTGISALATQINYDSVKLTNILIYNRLFWLMGAMILFLTVYRIFTFNQITNSIDKKKK